MALNSQNYQITIFFRHLQHPESIYTHIHHHISQEECLSKQHVKLCDPGAFIFGDIRSKV